MGFSGLKNLSILAQGHYHQQPRRGDFPSALERKITTLPVRHSWMPLSSMRGQNPLITPRKDENKKTKEKDKNMTRRKKPLCLSFLNVSIIALSVIPECLYQESKLFKDRNFWIPTPSSPRQFLSRGPQYWKSMDSRLKISGMTDEECCSWMSLAPFVRHPWTFLSGVHGI